MEQAQQMRLLYVEDDKAAARLLQRRLVRKGYSVDLAYDGVEGLAAWEQGSYDMLALDLDMPRMHGMEVIRALVNRGNLPPTIVITGAGNEATAVQAMKLGALDYIIKDSETRYLDLIPSVIEQALSARRLKREKEQAERDLRESEERLNLALDGGNLGVWDWNLASGEAFYSDKWAGMLGYLPHEADSTVSWWKSLLHPDDEPAVTSHMSRHLEGLTTHYEAEHRLLTKSHEWKWVVSRGKVVEHDELGHPVRFIGTQRDISHQKMLEAMLSQADRHRAVADLASGVAHNFNNLFQVVMGSSSLALLDLECGDLPAVLRNLEQVVDAAKMGSAVVDRLQASAGSSPLGTCSPAAVFDLNEVVAQAAEISKLRLTLAEEREQSQLCLEVDIGGPCPVMGNRNEILQVLMNLLENAVEAMPEGGVIRLQTAVQDKAVVFKVCDTGLGMSDEDVKRAFNPFFSTNVSVGRGLGLSICRSTIEHHGGLIYLEKNPDKGTTFTICLPWHPAGRP